MFSCSIISLEDGLYGLSSKETVQFTTCSSCLQVSLVLQMNLNLLVKLTSTFFTLHRFGSSPLPNLKSEFSVYVTLIKYLFLKWNNIFFAEGYGHLSSHRKYYWSRYSETLNNEYIERIHQMSYSSLSDNGMLQIFSFFN